MEKKRVMSEEARAARNAYRRKYYAEHKEKEREYMCRYWEKKAAEMQKHGDVRLNNANEEIRDGK